MKKLSGLPSSSVKKILQSMRDYETQIGAYFNADSYASWVNMRSDWALDLLRQFEESGDVMSVTVQGVTLWHVLA